MFSIKEQDRQLLQDILERNYYYYFKNNNMKNISISLFNNNNYNNSIFTKQVINNNDNNILNNLNFFIDWYLKQKFICDLFIEDYDQITDDIFKEKIFNILYIKFKENIENKNIYFSIEDLILEKKDLLFLQQQINLFKTININLIFTFKFNICEDNYQIYNNIIEFCDNNNYQIKIEINPKNISKQKNIFDYFVNNFLSFEKNLIFFEKESEEWIETKINEYIIFINYYIDFLLKKYNKKDFIDKIFEGKSLMQILSLKDKGIYDNSNCKGNCKFYNNLHIILNDLSLTMCKKIQYEELTIGNFIINNNEIDYCEPNNISALIIPAHLKRNMTPHCEYCSYVTFCPGFCHGDSYYKTLNPLISLRETCLLRTAKYNFIFYKFIKEQLFNENDLQKTSEHFKMLFNNIKNNLIKEE